MWSTSPPAVDWPTSNEDQPLAGMVAAPCMAYVNIPRHLGKQPPTCISWTRLNEKLQLVCTA
jgi:hypothetical protein